MEIMTFEPTELNGYPVIRFAEHKNCVTVMVRREQNPAIPYVVATWWPELKSTWSWGHYCYNSVEADAEFKAAKARNEKR
jgi:hypothetical protein